MESYYVYKHTAPSGKSYIGITSNNPLYRWQNGLGYTGQPKFYKAIKKYGWDNISHEILEEGLTKEQACEKEIAYIKQYDSFNNGYNASAGGEWNNLKYLLGESYNGFTVIGRTERKLRLQCNECGFILERYAGSLQKGSVKCKCKTKYNPNPKPMNYCIIEYNGKTQSLKQWSKELGIPAGTIRKRYKKGQPIDIPRQGFSKIKVCESCGKEFTYKSKDQKYCCQRCEWDSMKAKRKTFVCLSCGKEFVGHRSLNKDYKAKFCCIQCRINWQKTTYKAG